MKFVFNLLLSVILCATGLMFVSLDNSYWHWSSVDLDINKITCTYEQKFEHTIYKTLPYKDNLVIALCATKDYKSFVKCIDTKTNRIIWEKNNVGRLVDSIPIIVDKYLYLPSGYLRCIDLGNGEEIFCVRVDNPECSIDSVEYVDDDRVIVSGLNFIASISIKFQKQEWSREFFGYGKDCSLCNHADDWYPSVMQQKDFIWFVSKCRFYKIQYNGQILEEHVLPEAMYRACLDKTGKYLFTVSDMTLYCFDLNTFKTVWQYTNDYKSKAKRSDTYNGTTTLAYDNSRLYCTFNYYHKYNGIICFDPLTGKELWRKDGFDEQPVGYNDCLFLIDTDHKTQKLSTSLSILNCKTGDIQKLIGPFEGFSNQQLSIDKSKFILSFNNWHYPDEGKYVEAFMKVYDY